jgi:hypothetical protein
VVVIRYTCISQEYNKCGANKGKRCQGKFYSVLTEASVVGGGEVVAAPSGVGTGGLESASLWVCSALPLASAVGAGISTKDRLSGVPF